MTKKKSEETVLETATETPKKKVVLHPKVKTVSFEQWATLRGKKPHHWGGLKAHAKNALYARTLQEWDELFKNY
jgi:hypothetical protein